MLYLWCWSTFEKFFGAAQRIAEYAALKWEGSQKARKGVTYDVGTFMWLQKPWPLEIDDLPVKTVDFPAMWQITRGHKYVYKCDVCALQTIVYTHTYMWMYAHYSYNLHNF